MIAIARYALKGPYHAATVAGVLAILSLFIPLVSVVSGAIVGLIILTQGLASGTRVILISIAGITVIIYLVTKSPLHGITIGLVQWLPMVVLAEVLRRSSSLSFTLVAGMVLALLAVAVQFILWPDTEQLWYQVLSQAFSGLQSPGVDAEKLELMVRNIAHWMTVLLAAVMYSTFVATLLVSRWVQARLTESDGYRREFYSIRLGQMAAGATLAVSVAAMWVQQDWLTAMAMVMLSAFLYQGLAIVHSWSKQHRKSIFLFVLYAVMIVFPQAVAGTALLGIVDNWMDFRARLKLHTDETDE